MFCPHCGERIRIRFHGFYERYGLEQGVKVAVPRFRCLNPKCAAATFSILPFPFLRYKRHSLCCLLWIWAGTVVALAKLWGWSWHAAAHVIAFSRDLKPWYEAERKEARWGPNPRLTHLDSWTAFTTAFSHRFYPRRWPERPTT